MEVQQIYYKIIMTKVLLALIILLKENNEIEEDKFDG